MLSRLLALNGGSAAVAAAAAAATAAAVAGYWGSRQLSKRRESSEDEKRQREEAVPSLNPSLPPPLPPPPQPPLPQQPPTLRSIDDYNRDLQSRLQLASLDCSADFSLGAGDCGASDPRCLHSYASFTRRQYSGFWFRVNCSASAATGITASNFDDENSDRNSSIKSRSSAFYGRRIQTSVGVYFPSQGVVSKQDSIDYSEGSEPFSPERDIKTDFSEKEILKVQVAQQQAESKRDNQPQVDHQNSEPLLNDVQKKEETAEPISHYQEGKIEPSQPQCQSSNWHATSIFSWLFAQAAAQPPLPLPSPTQPKSPEVELQTKSTPPAAPTINYNDILDRLADIRADLETLCERLQKNEAKDDNRSDCGPLDKDHDTDDDGDGGENKDFLERHSPEGESSPPGGGNLAAVETNVQKPPPTPRHWKSAGRKVLLWDEDHDMEEQWSMDLPLVKQTVVPHYPESDCPNEANETLDDNYYLPPPPPPLPRRPDLEGGDSASETVNEDEDVAAFQREEYLSIQEILRASNGWLEGSSRCLFPIIEEEPDAVVESSEASISSTCGYLTAAESSCCDSYVTASEGEFERIDNEPSDREVNNNGLLKDEGCTVEKPSTTNENHIVKLLVDESAHPIDENDKDTSEVSIQEPIVNLFDPLLEALPIENLNLMQQQQQRSGSHHGRRRAAWRHEPDVENIEYSTSSESNDSDTEEQQSKNSIGTSSVQERQRLPVLSQDDLDLHLEMATTAASSSAAARRDARRRLLQQHRLQQQQQQWTRNDGQTRSSCGYRRLGAIAEEAAVAAAAAAAAAAAVPSSAAKLQYPSLMRPSRSCSDPSLRQTDLQWSAGSRTSPVMTADSRKAIGDSVALIESQRQYEVSQAKEFHGAVRAVASSRAQIADYNDHYELFLSQEQSETGVTVMSEASAASAGAAVARATARAAGLAASTAVGIVRAVGGSSAADDSPTEVTQSHQLLRIVVSTSCTVSQTEPASVSYFGVGVDGGGLDKIAGKSLQPSSTFPPALKPLLLPPPPPSSPQISLASKTTSGSSDPQPEAMIQQQCLLRLKHQLEELSARQRAAADSAAPPPPIAALTVEAAFIPDSSDSSPDDDRTLAPPQITTTATDESRSTDSRHRELRHLMSDEDALQLFAGQRLGPPPAPPSSIVAPRRSVWRRRFKSTDLDAADEAAESVSPGQDGKSVSLYELHRCLMEVAATSESVNNSDASLHIVETNLDDVHAAANSGASSLAELGALSNSGGDLLSDGVDFRSRSHRSWKQPTLRLKPDTTAVVQARRQSKFIERLEAKAKSESEKAICRSLSRLELPEWLDALALKDDESVSDRRPKSLTGSWSCSDELEERKSLPWRRKAQSEAASESTAAAKQSIPKSATANQVSTALLIMPKFVSLPSRMATRLRVERQLEAFKSSNHQNQQQQHVNKMQEEPQPTRSRYIKQSSLSRSEASKFSPKRLRRRPQPSTTPPPLQPVKLQPSDFIEKAQPEEGKPTSNRSTPPPPPPPTRSESPAFHSFSLNVSMEDEGSTRSSSIISIDRSEADDPAKRKSAENFGDILAEGPNSSLTYEEGLMRLSETRFLLESIDQKSAQLQADGSVAAVAQSKAATEAAAGFRILTSSLDQLRTSSPPLPMPSRTATGRCSNPRCSRVSGNVGTDVSRGVGCPNCSTVGYCSDTCRRSHWAAHSRVCAFDRQLAACRQALRCVATSRTAPLLARLASQGTANYGCNGFVQLVFSDLESSNNSSDMPSLIRPPTFLPWNDPAAYRDESALKEAASADSSSTFAICAAVPMGASFPQTRGNTDDSCYGGPLLRCWAIVRCDADDPEAEKRRSRRRKQLADMQRELRRRGVSLRHHYPKLFALVREFVETGADFPTEIIQPVDGNTGIRFECQVGPVTIDNGGWLTEHSYVCVAPTRAGKRELATDL